MGFTHDDKNNKSVDWYTPPYIFEWLDTEFDLDPCQPKNPVPWIPAKKHYWEDIDGLSLPWEGKVWLNPPYGKHTGQWLDKMSEHGNGIALVFARTDTIWFQNITKQADAILFLKGRISFVDGLGVTAGSGAGAGSMLIAWGEESVKDLEKLKDKGLFVRLQEN